MSDKTPRVPTYGPQQKLVIDSFLAAANPKAYVGQDIIGSFINAARSSTKK